MFQSKSTMVMSSGGNIITTMLPTVHGDSNIITSNADLMDPQPDSALSSQIIDENGIPSQIIDQNGAIIGAPEAEAAVIKSENLLGEQNENMLGERMYTQTPQHQQQHSQIIAGNQIIVQPELQHAINPSMMSDEGMIIDGANVHVCSSYY